MAGNIKGITIEFRGDTTKLDKALRQINNETRNIDRELKNVEKALKFNPTSVELWRQKQELLTRKINETKEKLDLLKNAQAQMDADGVDKNSEEYRKLQREIIETESKVKTFKNQLQQVGNVKLKAASEQIKTFGDNLTKAGNAMKGISLGGAAVAGSIGAIAYKGGVAADDLNTLSKVTGIGTTELQKYSAAADLVDVSVETIAKSNQRLKRSMSSAQDGSKKQAEAFKALGVDVTNADGSLRDSDAVFQDVIGALGTMSNETERDALAMEIMGKSASELNPLIEDGGETYKQVADTFAKYDLEFATPEQLAAANEFNDSLDTMKAMGAVALQTIGTQLAGYLAPALEKVVGWIGSLTQWLSGLSPEVLTVIGIIGGVIAVIAPVLLILGKVAFAISSIISLIGTVGPVIAGLAGPIGIAIAVIGTLIAIGILLYKNWDTIKAKVAALKAKLVSIWESIKSTVISKVTALKDKVSSAWTAIKDKATSMWNKVKESIITPIQNARDKVKAIIDKIKGFFPFHIGNIIKGMKLPHFNISGKFSLNPPSVPSFGVKWYANGGIFDSPSVIGVGEAGSEAVVPLDKFWKKLDNLQGETNVVINVYAREGQSTKEIAKEVQRLIVAQTKGQRLAWQ